jgi:polar amino acid transport system permease protein
VSAPTTSEPESSGSQKPGSQTTEADQLRTVAVRHPGRYVAVAVLVVLLAMVVHGLVTNDQFQWGVVRQYLTADVILQGLVTTLELTAISMVVGIVLGIVLAVMRLSSNPMLSGASWVYVWIFRGTPVLVQLLFWNFFSVLYPQLSIGIPFGPHFASAGTNVVISQFTAAILGLGLNEAAYMAEIVRAGILSIDEGQNEAAAALGMTRLQTMRRIVLPQAMRVIIPPTGNETISLLKTSSTVFVIALAELTYSAQIIYNRTAQQIPLLLVASIWYLLVTTVLTIGQYYIERRFARGSSRNLPPTPLQRLRGNLFDGHGGLAAAWPGSDGRSDRR